MRASVITLLAATLLSTALLLAGCAPDSPEQVVEKFLESIQDNDWYGYLDSVLPERVRELDSGGPQTCPECGSVLDSEWTRSREAFNEHREIFNDIQLEVEYLNPEEAVVTMVGGNVERWNEEMGQMESRDILSFPEEQRKINTVKYKGRWYVDIILSRTSRAEPRRVDSP